MASRNQKTPPQKKGMSKKKKTVTIIVVIAVAVALIAGVVATIVLSNWEQYKQYAADRKTVATCNGYEIPYEELYFLTMFYKDALASTHGADIWHSSTRREYNLPQARIRHRD